MTWMDAMQLAGGAALVVFGLNETAVHSGALIERFISAFSERFRHCPGSQLAAGLLAGCAMQGRRGAAYVCRRRLAGLLSLPQAIGMAIGMAVGMMLPATAVWLLPDRLRYSVLIGGLLLGMMPRPEGIRRLGRALTGLGCCWVGFAACQAVLPATFALHAAIGMALLPLAFCFRIPAALWLLFAATSPAASFGMLLAAAVSAMLGWSASLIHAGARLKRPFQPSASLLDARELRFPERVLQAVLQEIRRLAEGLAQATDGWLPVCVDKPPANRDAIEAVEQALNEFKPAAQRFLKHLARRRLDERQAQILLHLDRCVSDLERIGDHLHRLAMHTLAEPHRPPLPAGLLAASREAAVAANALLATVAASITGRHEIAEAAARRVLDSREQAIQALDKAMEALQQAMEAKALPPEVALRCRDGYAHLERLIRHVRAIALVEMQPEFWINPDAIYQRAAIMHTPAPRAVSPRPYLERLQAEEAER